MKQLTELFSQWLRHDPQVVSVLRADLERLAKIEAIAVKLVQLLDDGKVDYELVEKLKGVLSG